MRRNVRDCMAFRAPLLVREPGAGAGGRAGSGTSAKLASGPSALDARLLLELDLVARADDVVVPARSPLTDTAASRGMFRTCSRTFQIPRTVFPARSRSSRSRRR